MPCSFWQRFCGGNICEWSRLGHALPGNDNGIAKQAPQYTPRGYGKDGDEGTGGEEI